MSIENNSPDPEGNKDVLFEVMYATAAGRLQEGLSLQGDKDRYFHVSQEHFHEFDHDFAGFTLAEDYKSLIDEGSEHFDVMIPAKSLSFGDNGLINAVELFDDVEPYFLISTKKYDLQHRYVINRQTVGELDQAPDAELHDLEDKLMTYQLVPFLIQDQSA